MHGIPKPDLLPYQPVLEVCEFGEYVFDPVLAEPCERASLVSVDLEPVSEGVEGS